MYTLLFKLPFTADKVYVRYRQGTVEAMGNASTPHTRTESATEMYPVNTTTTIMHCRSRRTTTAIGIEAPSSRMGSEEPARSSCTSDNGSRNGGVFQRVEYVCADLWKYGNVTMMVRQNRNHREEHGPSCQCKCIQSTYPPPCLPLSRSLFLLFPGRFKSPSDTVQQGICPC